ncbi:MAG: helix-turn-helix transcriptional regulator [Nitrospirota bacterium]|jgi:MerR family transcriptional regulator/heat shock protein HspR
MKKDKPLYLISVVAEMLGIHPQTLRLYEREGFVKPKRREGGVRMYSQEDVERIEMIIRFTRDLGVNLAGVEIILSMREKMEQMRGEMEDAMRQMMKKVKEELQKELMEREKELKYPLVKSGRTIKVKIDKE